MSWAEVHATVRDSMQRAVEAEIGVQPFSFSLEPPKPLADGGLGLQQNNWWAFLQRFKEQYLPDALPYSALVINSSEADRTYNQDLANTCFDFAQSIS